MWRRSETTRQNERGLCTRLSLLVVFPTSIGFCSLTKVRSRKRMPQSKCSCASFHGARRFSKPLDGVAAWHGWLLETKKRAKERREEAGSAALYGPFKFPALCPLLAPALPLLPAPSDCLTLRHRHHTPGHVPIHLGPEMSGRLICFDVSSKESKHAISGGDCKRLKMTLENHG